MVEPITKQPGTADNRLLGGGGGLNALQYVEELVVQQKKEFMEIFTCFETANKYTIKSVTGSTVFKAKEDTSCCNRNCCGPARAFDLNICDPEENLVIKVERPFRPCSGCCCCMTDCLNAVSVFSPPGNLVGTVHEIWHPCIPKYSINDPDGNIVLLIEGKCCPCSGVPCIAKCRDTTFQVVSADSQTQVGHIRKTWGGMAKEIFTDADNFCVKFPADMAVETKATLLGATFLIDFMYFEAPKNTE